jgi:DNA replication protein DnaC
MPIETYAEALARGKSAVFAAVPDLLDHLKATFRPSSDESYDERFELLRSANLLVLGDPGTGNATPARACFRCSCGLSVQTALPSLGTVCQHSST